MPTVNIGSTRVGVGEPTYLIAEIGINHNGSLENAIKLIDNAKAAGFDAVKFQKRTVDVVYTEAELNTPRESVFGKTNGDLKRGLEFSRTQYESIAMHCQRVGIQWFASPWDEASVDFLEELDVVAHKVASASLTDKGLLERLASTGKPILLSTGMSNLEQIARAVAILDHKKLILLHTVSTYPAVDSDLNLSALETLKNSFPDIPVGYSGHEVGVLPSLIAVARYSAVCIERHVTLDRASWGSDQAASLELPGMVKLARDIREIPKLVGNGKKEIIEKEIPIMKKLRRVDSI